MKINFSSRYLALLFGASTLLPCLSFGGLTWETQRIELTTKSGDKQAVAIFRFKNSGVTPVDITDVKPSCGCTTAELAKSNYAPGEAGEIKAVFTIGDRIGLQEKIIQVTADVASAKPVSLVLRINIPELFTFTPRLLLWRIGDALEEKPVVITPLDSHQISAIAVKLITPTAATYRIESFDSGAKHLLFVRPKSTAGEAQIALFCVAQLADGSSQPFTVYALVR